MNKKKLSVVRVLADEEFARLTPEEKLAYLTVTTQAVRTANADLAKDAPQRPSLRRKAKRVAK